MTDNNKIFLLDAYALIFRAYYAFIANPIKNSKGFNTSTIFGFVNTLDEILRKENPGHIAVVFDPSTPTFRHEIFPDYKAHREETPEDIRSSVPWIKKILTAYNIPVIEVDNYEADDVIGTIARKAEKKGLMVYMMTPDKDYAQLVTGNILMYKPKRLGNDVEIWGVDEVRKKFCIERPAQVIDILSLWGDASDNIPGVPGIGEKTSIKLISEYGSLENLLDHLDDLKGKLKENLQTFREQAIMSKQLATIHEEVPFEFDLNLLKRSEPDVNILKSLFEELEFKTLISRILPSETSPPTPEVQGDLFSGLAGTTVESRSSFESISTLKKSYHLLTTTDEIKSLCEKIAETGQICFDTETTGLDVMTASLVGVSVSLKEHEGYFLYMPEDKEETKKLLAPLKVILEDPAFLKIGQNLKYDIRVLYNYGIITSGPVFDTMIAHYLLEPEQRHNLNILSEKYLNYSPVKIEELIGPKGRQQKTMRHVDPEKLKDYASEDADLALQLYHILKKELKDKHLDHLAHELEMPLVPVLADIEHTGVRLDIEALEVFGRQLVKEIIISEERIFELAGMNFNISSPKQLGEVLFDRLKIVTDAKKTRTKQYSTGEDILSKLGGKHEIIPEVLNFRSLRKLLSTYVESLPKMVNASTACIHTSFNQAVAATGRLSSNNPNLQNIPIREERGREIRKAFIPRGDDYVLLSADYSQIELRLMAHMSQDKNMIEAFRRNEDIHTTTAARIHGVSRDEVTREMRSSAKTANFGIIYGISSFGLAQRLNIPTKEAKALIDGYFDSFPGVRAYMDNIIRKAREEGCVYTIMGRQRHLPDIHSRNSIVRGVAERNAINAPLQGSAADIIKIAMINIHSRLLSKGMRSKMILQVHDELVFDVYKPELEDLKQLVKDGMEHALELSVPLTVDMGEGSNWLEAH